ncbi:MAG: ABC transporter permease [Lishizhenia sp.]
MNKVFFIANKIHKGNHEGKKVSQPIVRISMFSIALAVAINIITIAVVTGFQNQVKDKVVGFGAHLQILKAGELSSFESEPILKTHAFLPKLKEIENVRNVHPFAYKPTLLQSKPDTVWYTINAKDTFQIEQEIQGVVMKGIDSTFDLSFFESKLTEGRLPNLNAKNPTQEILISQNLANNLQLKLGDKARAFFIKQNPIKQVYLVVGIFKSGLEELDNKIILGDIRNVQKLNDWGIKTALRVADTLTSDHQLVIYTSTKGGNGNYKYDFGEGWERNIGFTYCGTKDTLIKVIVGDYWQYMNDEEEGTTIPDTAYLKITVIGNKNKPCTAILNKNNQIEKVYLKQDGTRFSISFEGEKKLIFEYIDGKGTHNNYIGGYEVNVKNWDELEKTLNEVTETVLFTENSNQTLTNNLENLKVKSIKEEQEEIFMWLSFLDLNVYIILILMLLIGIINMGSGLLVLIISKTNFIGLMKAIGSSNWLIRKLFLYQAGVLIFKGMLLGNIVGIAFCLLQSNFNILPLNPEIYYLNAVPVEINLFHILLLNIGTLVICTAALIIPSYVITKISPVKALKFD